MLDPDDRSVAKGTLCAQARAFNLHASTKVITDSSAREPGGLPPVLAVVPPFALPPEPPPEPPCYGLPALDGLTPTEAAARPKEDRVEYVQMKDPTATPNKNAKQTAAQNLALPM